MSASNFSERDLTGENALYQDTVTDIQRRYGFGFVSIGLTAFPGAPLKWIYGAGASNERYKRIVLSPGHGIGGIVIKSGKPMMFLDIDEQIDPREYSSYPIVFAEGLRSFCALPLLKHERVAGALLCAHRTVDAKNEGQYRSLIDELDGKLADFELISHDFLYIDKSLSDREESLFIRQHQEGSSLSPIIMAQEEERRRISRELHDGIAQELMSVSFLLRQMNYLHTDTASQAITAKAQAKVGAIMDELHNLSVELRPSTLDHLGIMPALRSQALIFEKTYGAQIRFTDNLKTKRFSRALETQVFRICQEAILNACKYSGSEVVLVELEDDGKTLLATIIDVGHGFDPIHPEIKGSGCGLAGIKERAHLIGATLEIASNSQRTKVSLSAPLTLENEE